MHNTEKSLAALAWLSRNGGLLDIKENYSAGTGGIYTTVYYNGKITTARTIGNILFGMNMADNQQRYTNPGLGINNSFSYDCHVASGQL